jgi:hypothetical protein
MRWIPAWARFRAAVNISGTIVFAASTEGTPMFKIKRMKVTGPILQGSTANNVTANYGVSGDVLIKLVAQFRNLLTTADLSDGDRNDIEVNLELIDEEVAAAQPKPKRLRALLHGLYGALIGGALAGVEAGTKQETIHLIEMAQNALPPG